MNTCWSSNASPEVIFLKYCNDYLFWYGDLEADLFMFFPLIDDLVAY